MRAVRLHRPGDESRLRLEELPWPEPGPGQVRVRLAAAGVNFIDIYQRTGLYPLDLPATLGLEGAGTVEAVGRDAGSWQPGDRVAFAGEPGAYAEAVIVPADRLLPVPEAVPLETAAAAMLQGMTAWCLTRRVFDVQPGQFALVHAAAGGVGGLLVQLIAARGGRVIATAGSAAKAARAQALGAQVVVNYREADFVGAVAEATDGAGVAVAYDGVGQATFEGSRQSLARRGMLVLYGQASGVVETVAPKDLAAGSLFLTRPSLFHYIDTPAALAEAGQAVLQAVAAGELEVRVDRTLPLAEAGRAHALLAGRRSAGKLLLTP
ncbi:MAG TPA: quinone oxidoreductase [Gammaproteobacteria bacterium]|nr:quinone oxidoreductase [Gammaproteobacteria bacterium]